MSSMRQDGSVEKCNKKHDQVHVRYLVRKGRLPQNNDLRTSLLYVPSMNPNVVFSETKKLVRIKSMGLDCMYTFGWN